MPIARKSFAHIYQQGIRALVAQGKPVAITSSVATTQRGAADQGGHGGAEMIEFDGTTRSASMVTTSATSRSRLPICANC